jgi:hypothetical protein
MLTLLLIALTGNKSSSYFVIWLTAELFTTFYGNSENVEKKLKNFKKKYKIINGTGTQRGESTIIFVTSLSNPANTGP